MLAPLLSNEMDKRDDHEYGVFFMNVHPNAGSGSTMENSIYMLF